MSGLYVVPSAVTLTVDRESGANEIVVYRGD